MPPTTPLHVLPLKPIGPALINAARQLEGSPAGIAPWSFEGTGLPTPAVNLSDGWQHAERILVPLAFNALGMEEWETDFDLDAAARAAFFARFDAISRALLNTLPSYRARPEAHVFIQWGDLALDLPCLSAGRQLLKVSASKTSHAEAMPYFIDDLEDLSDADLPGGTIDTAPKLCGFIGNLDTHPLRRRLAAAIEQIDPQGHHIHVRHTVAGPADRQRERYFTAMRESRFVLCPRGGGLTSVRFFETLALGRIPVLIADDTRLPLEDRIPYDGFMVRVPETDLTSLLERIVHFEQSNDLASAAKQAVAVFRSSLRYSEYFKLALRGCLQKVHRTLAGTATATAVRK